MRKCNRSSPLYRTASDEKLGMGLGTRLHSNHLLEMVSVNVLLPTKWPSHPPGNAHVDMFEALAKKLETLMNDEWLLSSVQPSTVLFLSL